VKSTSMMYVDEILDGFTNKDSSRQAFVFKKTDAHSVPHYGCRYYDNQIFRFDEFYPTKNIHYAERAAQNWINGVKKS
jgi:hypothetical protein